MKSSPPSLMGMSHLTWLFKHTCLTDILFKLANIKCKIWLCIQYYCVYLYSQKINLVHCNNLHSSPFNITNNRCVKTRWTSVTTVFCLPMCDNTCFTVFMITIDDRRHVWKKGKHLYAFNVDNLENIYKWIRLLFN